MTINQKLLRSLAENSRDYEKMHTVPDGEFFLGCDLNSIHDLMEKYNYHAVSLAWFDDETPERLIHLPRYTIDKFPVTNAQFARFVLETNYLTLAERENWGVVFTERWWRDIEGACWYQPTGPGGPAILPSQPVVQISWFDAVEYSKWTQKRLPTEFEWEKAAKGQERRLWPWGNQWEKNSCACADILANADFTTREAWHSWWRSIYHEHLNLLQPVDSYPMGKSPYGISDMAGLVYEWVEDWYEAYDPQVQYKGDYARFLGKKIFKVIRGGCWMNFKFQVRTTERMQTPPHQRTFVSGFRCAK